MLSGTERAVMLHTKLAIVFFALAALVFAIFSNDQLVLMARVSFAGTALLAPLVLGAILSTRPPGVEVIVATALAIVLFLASSLGLIAGTVGSVRMDLLLLLSLGVITVGSIVYRTYRSNS